MSKTLLTTIFLTVWFLHVESNYDDRAKIRTSDGNLYLEPARGKNIYLRTNGPQSTIFLGDVNLSNVTKTSGPSQAPINVDTLPSAPNDVLQRLQALESRNLVSHDDFVGNISALALRASRINTRLTRLQRQIDSWSGNKCQLHTCQNGGTCLNLVGDFHCLCPSNWEGRNCEIDVNECRNFAGTDLGCQNGADCINKPGSYECQCRAGWYGTHCTRRKMDCSAGNFEMCGHGTCVPVNSGEGIKCICDQGWTTNGSVACLTDVNECDNSLGPRCSTNPKVECINLPGSFRCGQCPPGFQGDGYVCYDINECAVSNGGCSSMVSCHNTIGSRICGACPPGYLGDGITCTWRGSCSVDHGGCHPSARCVENPGLGGGVQCECPQGMDGDGVGLNGCYVSSENGTKSCDRDPCGPHGRCHMLRNGYTCFCFRGFTGAHCDVKAESCATNPCKNGGVCRADDSAAGGFRCECTAQYTGTLCQERSHCGSILRAEEGNLIFPLSNTSYASNSKCAWIIRTVPEKVINVTFTRFNLERSPDCTFDFLQIHDGRSTADPLIGRFCGSDAPKGGNILSNQHNLYLWFLSNGASNNNGFALHWTSIAPVCGGEVNATAHGAISSPGSPGKYPPNRDCYWHLTTSLGKRIQLHFFQLDLETHQNCSFDYLAIYDGPQVTDQLLDKYCSSTQPAPIQSTGPEIFIHFHSDAHSFGKGFQITYAPVEGVPGCGGVFSGDKGEISSPTFDGLYYNNMFCEYKIRTGPGTQIQLDFQYFNVERSRNCREDSLKIYDGPSSESPIMGTYCGILDRKITLNSTSNSVFMVFKTDRSIRREGFKISYKIICKYFVRGDTGEIKSPGYPFTYPDNRVCEYVIEASPGKAIQLTFQDFDVEGDTRCNFDKVEVRDGWNANATLLGKFCGSKIPPTRTSSHNMMYITFESDMSQSGGGFYANYTTVDVQCGGIYKENTGTINYPTDGRYEKDQTCTWMILAPEGKHIKLSWNRFELEKTASCTADHLDLIAIDEDNNKSTLVSYCDKTPPTLTVTSSSLMLKFTSDSSFQFGGFSVTYAFIDAKGSCGGTYVQQHGVIYSPGYPRRYDKNLDCIWLISVTSGQQIKLNISQFDVEDANYRTGHCDDYLRVRNGPAEASPLIADYCGEFKWKSIISMGNSLYLHFHSDFLIGGAGFKIEWDTTSTGCGGTFTGYEGSISSPNYPESYRENSECFYRIVTNQGSKLSLTFLALEMERFLCDDYVEIYDGRDPESPSLGRFCKFSQNKVIETTSNYAFLKFKSDFLMNGKGFLLTYNAICNNNLTGDYGVIESLNYPSSYPGNMNCTWTIRVPKGNRINATFTHFDVRPSPRYTYSYVSHPGGIFDSPVRRFGSGSPPYNNGYIVRRRENASCSIDYLLIGELDKIDHSARHCDTSKPIPVSTKGNSLQVRFYAKEESHHTHSGFRLEWVSYGCRGHIKKRNGVLNKTLSSSDQMECQWLIETPLGTNIYLHFLKVYMLETNDCHTDAIEVYNGPTDSYPLLTKFCHDIATVQSTSNYVLVKLTKNSSLKDLHFSATFTAIYASCGGFMRSQSGVITSKNYPRNYENNLDCLWTITVPSSHRIAIDFTDIDLDNDDDDNNNCGDTIKLYDGVVWKSNYTHRICGASAQKNYISKSNTLKVQFVTDNLGTAKGFKANFSMTCGGVISTTENTENGIITTEKYKSYSNSSCIWTILAPKLEQKVTLTLTHIWLPILNNRRANDTCPNSYLKIFDGNDEKAPLYNEYCGHIVPATIVSRGSALTLELGTHDDRINGYFIAHYSTVATSCGGSLTSASGVIASPNYNNPYPHNTDCEWKLKTSPGNRVYFNILDLDIGYSEGCNQDYLEIREHDGAGRILGLYCGKRTDTINIISASQLYIKFRSDNNVEPGTGFLLNYAFMHGNDITDLDKGEIASPLYPRLFGRTGEYWWRITSGNQIITIDVDDLQIHTHSETCDDNLSIYDGHNDEAPLLKKLCGALHSASEVIRTTSNAAYIKLTLNDANTGGLFHLRWARGDRDVEMTSDTPNCGNNSTVTLNPGNTNHITSPNYPERYGEYQNCEWVYKATPGRHLVVQFVDFDVEERDPCTNGDFVSIFTSTVPAEWKPVKENICLKSDVTRQVFNGSTYLKMTFTSDYSIEKKGFLAQVRSYCGGILTDPSGVIEVDQHDFDNDIRGLPHRCDWRVKVRPGRRIKVMFTYFNITNDKTDCKTYVVLHNGESLDSPRLSDGKYCGYSYEKINEIAETTSSNLVVSYVSSDTRLGNFKIHYEEVQINCGVTSKLDAEHPWEIITTPHYPNVPDPYSECNYEFTGPVGEILRIDFIERFDLKKDDDCVSEFVEIHDGASLLAPVKGRFCGSNPGTIKTTGNAVIIKYGTELTEPNNGFKANVSIDVCGGTITASEGTITSPGYPNDVHFPAGTVCEWRIIGTEGRALTITPHEMDLPDSDAECGTKVTIEEFEPGNNIDEILKTYCTQRKLDVAEVQTSTNNVTIKLHIGTTTLYASDVEHPRFRLTFKSTLPSCHGELTTSEGYLTSPRYPRESTLNFCSWLIKVPDQTRRISLEILDSGKYNIYISEGDFEQTLAYRYNYDIANDNTTFKSSGNKMSINVRKPHDGPFKFRARFTSDEPAVCGGSLTGETGHLTSLNTDDPYFCAWNYKADDQMDLDEYNTLFLTGYVNSTASSTRKRCLYFDPKLTIRVPFDNFYNQRISHCNSQFTYRIPSRTVQINAKKGNDQHLNFDLQWKLKQCGGAVNVGETSVNVISIPKSYNDTIECAWKLKSSPALSRTEIKVEGSFQFNCDDEFIQISRYDFSPFGNHVLGEYCKDKLQDKPLTVPYNVIVEYHSKAQNSSVNVSARTVTQECGGQFMYPSQFSSPNFPKGYSSNTECVWELVSKDAGFRVSLNFINRFVVEKAPNCSKDAVIIYDWKNEDYFEVARLCGRDLPPVFNSTGDRLKVVLRTDGDVNLDGFEAKWTMICGGTFIATTKEQYIYSPGYPFYLRSKTCVYKISAPGEKMQLQFLDFDLEGYSGSCDNDNLTISSMYVYETHCGSEIPKFTTMLNEVEMTFNSDSTISKRGFKLAYSIYSCGGEVKEPTTITTGPLENYDDDMNCTWYIEAPLNKTVVLDFAYFNLEQAYDCNADYLAVYEGSQTDEDKRLALLCGEIKSSTTIKSKGNTMALQFVSDPYLNYRGFKINVIFTYSESAGCGGDLNIISSYTLKSPHINSPYTYENFLDCHWNILAPLDHVIKVSFSSFHIAPCKDINQTAIGYSQCDCDFVQIKDGTNPDSLMIGTYCGHTIPPELVTSNNRLSIRLSTDGEITSSGFEANLVVMESVCGASLFNVSGIKQRIKSPDYDTGSINRGIHCGYHFTVPAAHQLVQIHFNDFDLQPETNKNICDKDKIVVSTGSLTSRTLGKDYIRSEVTTKLSTSILMYYDAYSNSTLPEKYIICGSKKSIDIYVKGSFAVNVITSPDEVTQQYRGVDFEVSLVGFCGRNYTQSYGKIVSVYEPDVNENITDCYTLITAPENNTISVYFDSAEASFVPPNTFLEVYDGKTTSSKKALTLNDVQAEPTPVFSTGRYILLHNHLTSFDNHVTYDLTYMVTDKGQGCGGYFYGTEGTVTSPLYPSVYRQSKTCEWELETHRGTKISLYFDTFDLGRDCDHNYVQLVDRSGTVLSTYCSESPATFTSVDNYVKIVFVTTRNNGGTGWVVKFVNIV